MDLDLAGPTGELRYSYLAVAVYSGWKLETIGPSLYRLRASVESCTPAHLSLRPLRAELALPRGGRRWSFACESVSISGPDLEAWLSGDPEIV